MTSSLWSVSWQHADLNESGGLDRVELEKLLKEQLLMRLPDQDNDVIFSLLDHSSKSLPSPLQVFSLFPFHGTLECDDIAMRYVQVASDLSRPMLVFVLTDMYIDKTVKLHVVQVRSRVGCVRFA